MIKLNNKTEETLRQMYNILIENLFITYPDFLKNKDKHDNKENYNKWTNMIKNEKDYNIITCEEGNQVLGILSYQPIENVLWICEVQIRREYKNKKIFKRMLKKFVSLNKKNKEVTIHINDANKISKEVFTHIGFKPVGKTVYKIEMTKLIEYIKDI